MSVLPPNIEQVEFSPIYYSTSKQLYSFPKSERFPSPAKLINCEKIYDMPSTKTCRFTTFGYGRRSSFQKVDAPPPPNQYTLSSDFDLKRVKAHIYTFGTCREAYSKVYTETHPDKGRGVPGPGTYQIKQRSMGHDTLKYSMRPRTRSEPRGSRVPGPGTYDMLSGISSKGNQFYSKFKSSKAPSFHPPHSKRFIELRIFSAYNAIIAKSVKLQPGPGHYQVSPSINPKGSYFVSKFRSSMCRTFGFERRNSYNELLSRATTPGPGTYRAASNFFSVGRKQDIVRQASKIAKVTITTPRNYRVDKGVESCNNSPMRATTATRLSTSSSTSRKKLVRNLLNNGGVKPSQ